jgi:hypothetical protein
VCRQRLLTSLPSHTAAEQVEASEAGASKADGAAGDTGVLSVSAGATQRRNRGPPDASDFFMPRDGLLNPSKAPDFGRVHNPAPRAPRPAPRAPRPAPRALRS